MLQGLRKKTANEKIRGSGEQLAEMLNGTVGMKNFGHEQANFRMGSSEVEELR